MGDANPTAIQRVEGVVHQHPDGSKCPSGDPVPVSQSHFAPTVGSRPRGGAGTASGRPVLVGTTPYGGNGRTCGGTVRQIEKERKSEIEGVWEGVQQNDTTWEGDRTVITKLFGSASPQGATSVCVKKAN